MAYQNKRKQALLQQELAGAADVTNPFDIFNSATQVLLPVLLKIEQVAQILSVTDRTLERWRANKYGPHAVKMTSGSIRYRAEDVVEFINSNLIRHTAQ